MRTLSKILLIVMIALAGCQPPQRTKPTVEPTYNVQLEMSPEMKAVVMQLVYMKSDPNVFKVREQTLDERFGLK